MAAELNIGGDASGAAKALGDVNQGIGAVTASAGKMEGAIEQAAETSELEKMQAEVYALQRALKEVEDQAERTGGSKSSGWTQLFTGVTAGIQVAEKLGQAFQKAKQFIKEMADAGNADFQRLHASVESISTAVDELILRLTTSTGAGTFMRAVADEASLTVSSLAHVQSGLDNVIDSFRHWVADTTGIESLKHWADELGGSTERVARANEEAYEAELKRQQLAKGAKIIADFEESRAKRAEQDAVEQISSLEEIDRLIQKQIDSTNELAKRGGITAKSEKDARENLLKLDTRRVAIVKQLAADQKQAAAELMQSMGSIASTGWKIFQDGMDQVKKLRDEKKKAADEEEADRLKRVAALRGADEVKDAAGKITADASGKQAVIDRLAANAKAKAEEEANADGSISKTDQRKIDQAARSARMAAMRQANGGPQIFNQDQISEAVKQNATATVDSLKASGQTSQDATDALSQVLGITKQFDASQAQQQQSIDGMRKELDSILGNAHRQATMQARGGRQAFSPEQIAEAQKQNADATTQALEGTGQVGGEMLDALKQNLQVAQQLDRDNALTSQEVAAIRKELNTLTGNARQRAQRGAKKL